MMEDEPDFDFSKDIQYEENLNLRKFYDELFPFTLLHEWLTINHTTTTNNQDFKEEVQKAFERREFSVRVIGEKVFTIRNKSFTKVEHLKEFLKGRNTTNQQTGATSIDLPIRLDIGPVYSWEPSKMSTVTDYYPVSRELVFDIDIDDYNDIRACCSNTGICHKCWGFLSVAAKFLDHYLRDCFGFEQIMFVFSGRRGLHCWVSDRSALFLQKENRQSIINHIRNEITANQLPVLKYSYDKFFLPFFEDHVVEEQELFSNQKQCDTLLSLIPIQIKRDKQIITPLENIKAKLEEIKNTVTDREIWFAIKKYLEDNNLREYLYQIVFTYTMPRIDEPVTIGMNHLLKAPFCIHPDTKKLCIPIELKNIDQFDPNQCPTLDQLLKPDTGLKLFNKYNQIFKNHIEKLKLKRNLQINDNDPMQF
ncbi:hypothetical protein DICPUDRAFT_76324 [Dictyostelium purpureum]|uniref:DNA primase n=1 Tax=Dictyostelium purpureum TaxID=5786 RepID=F0ZD96_DICPU|nr:uncharacterized protein DICPUDRAFT_76324 [Dictyostelium purpureum]EGC38068.1 hypothetical protein DICPUDRAFT_76324 [Dictyostelium purpureum]|eukprot:XP_003285375.1 hypothetical protein DICPUDRAFT_76324 [Dictyostelium purpureum]